MSERLDRILDEARADLRPADRDEADWAGADSRLFQRIARDSQDERFRAAHARYRGSPRVWGGVAVLAAAAAIAFVLHAPHSNGVAGGAAPSDGVATNVGARTEGGALASHEGTGEVRIAGAAVEAGRGLVVGDSVETTAAHAFFQTARAGGPGSVSWALEERTRIDVRRTSGALILALAQGAVEAQVTPVPNGEAFALDVGPTRVAVHGTHLRVAREGEHVVVDLTEGVVSIGAPPRSGSTYGTLVSAPAHVEFDASALAQTLRIDRTVSAVRAPARLAPVTAGLVNAGPANGVVAQNTRPEPSPSDPSMIEPTSPEAISDHTPPEHAEHASTPRHGSHASSPPPHADADGDPTAVVAAAVRACAGKGVNPADVRVTVSSKLSMQVGDDGYVHLAKFDPPLAPAAQECAARVIYKTHFPKPGAVTIPIEIAP